MNLEKAMKRDKILKKKKHGMRVSGKSLFVCVRAAVNKAKRIKEGK